MAAQYVTAEKRFRLTLLIDTYGELLTDRQRDFLQRYYEQDFSFGEIAREFEISRQAVFDSVKNGEASLERYERIMGLVAAQQQRRAAGGKNLASRLTALADKLRGIRADAKSRNGHGPTSDGLAKVEDVAQEIEAMAEELQEASAPPEPSPRGGRRAVFAGPEVD